MKSVEVGCIGVGWIGGLRAETLSRTALVDKLHLCDIKPDRLAEIKKLWQARDRDARLPGHHQQPQHLGRLHLDHAGSEPLPDRARLPESRQARDAGKADRAGAVGGGRADPAFQAQQPEVHDRLFAALQHQNRLRQEEDRRRHAGQGRLGAGEPPSFARARQEDCQPGAALAGGDGIDPRPRFRVLAAGAGKAGEASIRKAPMATWSRSTARTTSCSPP